MPYAGTAVMQDDGTLILRSRATAKPSATDHLQVGDRAYDSPFGISAA